MLEECFADVGSDISAYTPVMRTLGLEVVVEVDVVLWFTVVLGVDMGITWLKVLLFIVVSSSFFESRQKHLYDVCHA